MSSHYNVSKRRRYCEKEAFLGNIAGQELKQVCQKTKRAFQSESSLNQMKSNHFMTQHDSLVENLFPSDDNLPSDKT